MLLGLCPLHIASDHTITAVFPAPVCLIWSAPTHDQEVFARVPSTVRTDTFEGVSRRTRPDYVSVPMGTPASGKVAPSSLRQQWWQPACSCRLSHAVLQLQLVVTGTTSGSQSASWLQLSFDVQF